MAGLSTTPLMRKGVNSQPSYLQQCVTQGLGLQRGEVSVLDGLDVEVVALDAQGLAVPVAAASFHTEKRR